MAIPKHRDAAGKETPLPARITSYRADQTDPPLPHLEHHRLFDWLMDAGPVESGPMGQAALSWCEIDAWAARTFTRPSAWEARTLHRLSAEYLAELRAAEDQHRPPPWGQPGAEVDRATEERRLRAVLG